MSIAIDANQGQHQGQGVQFTSLFKTTQARTRALFDLVKPEAYWAQPIALRHPIVFYDGHIHGFLWNTLFRKVLGRPSFNPDFDMLFARGIDPASLVDAQAKSRASWPEPDEVAQYKACIDEALYGFLETFDPGQPASHPLLTHGEILYLLLEHEWMHQETLLYIIHQLPHHLKNPPQRPDARPPQPQIQPESIEIPRGEVRLGAYPGEFPYGWDNEFPAMTMTLARFAIDRYPITNGQFLSFVEAGGYANPEYWRPADWAWCQQEKKQHPFFWKRQDGQWQLRDLFEDIPLPLDWPVFVTQAEATAYARFVGKRLPTEAEFHRAAYGDALDAPYPWGWEAPGPTVANVAFQAWSPMPVGSHPKGASPYGVEDLVGDAWEWTATPFAPFPGFKPSQGYPQYSADFFDGQHYVMKGGSCFTDARLLRRPLRNWFYGHYPYMYAKFRCVSDAV